MKCEIIKDLLPNYVDGLTSQESNSEIDMHLSSCEDCRNAAEQMKVELAMETVPRKKETIDIFIKLNKRVFKAVIFTLLGCLLIVASYLYFFAFGWSVSSEDMNMEYVYADECLEINFELTNGRVLTAWPDRHTPPTSNGHGIKFRESFNSVLDDQGDHPNKFSYGIQCLEADGSVKEYIKEDYIVLQFKDKTETIYLKDLFEELDIK